MPSTRTPVHRAKRHGNHQKRSKHFLRVYMPYLPLLTTVIVGLLISTIWSPHRNRPGVLAYATEMSAGALLNATNHERANNAAGNLALNSKLNAAAQAKANDMSSRNYWAHNTPDGNPPWVFITNAGYSYNKAGENLACSVLTSQDTIDAWMSSASHKENMLNKDYTEVGFGFINADTYSCGDLPRGQQTIVVAMYATPYSSPKAAVKPTPAPAAVVPQQTTQTAAPAEPVKHDVQVLVLDVHNKPAAGIKVTLHSTPREMTTNKEGIALFKDVETGDHTATAEVNGAKRETAVSVAADAKTVEVTIPKPVPAASSTSNNSSSITKAPLPHKVSRLDMLTKGSLPWLTALYSSLAIVGLVYLAQKHGRALHRLIAHGERYVLQHALLDATIISFVWLSYVISRGAGFIL